MSTMYSFPQRALQGRYSCKAQGGMRAKPDMQPWVNTDKSGLSSVGAALLNTRLVCVIVGLRSGKCRSSSELKGCRKRLAQGLRPGLCRSIALPGLFADKPNSSICRKLSDLLERCRCLRLLLDLLGDVSVYTCCWIC